MTNTDILPNRYERGIAWMANYVMVSKKHKIG